MGLLGNFGYTYVEIKIIRESLSCQIYYSIQSVGEIILFYTFSALVSILGK